MCLARALSGAITGPRRAAGSPPHTAHWPGTGGEVMKDQLRRGGGPPPVPAGQPLFCINWWPGLREGQAVLMSGGCWLAAGRGWWRAAARERVGCPATASH